MNEISAKSPEKSCINYKTNVYRIHDTCSLNTLDLNDYGPKDNRGSRYVSIVIVKISKFGRTVPLEKQNC